jgi:hypothetical protein
VSAHASPAALQALEGLPPLARAEHQLAQAQRALAARQKEAAAADEVLAVCEKRLAEVKADAARAKQASPAAKANGSAGGAGLGAAAAAGVPSPIKEELDAKFKLPAHLHEYTGAVSGVCVRVWRCVHVYSAPGDRRGGAAAARRSVLAADVSCLARVCDATYQSTRCRRRPQGQDGVAAGEGGSREEAAQGAVSCHVCVGTL